jgi:hypothetical protein
MSGGILDKYMPSQGGIVGVWNSGTNGISNITKTIGTLPENLVGKGMEWGNVLMYGGVIIIGGVLLLIAFSFASGKQDMAAVTTAAGNLAKTAATKGMA